MVITISRLIVLVIALLEIKTSFSAISCYTCGRSGIDINCTFIMLNESVIVISSCQVDDVEQSNKCKSTEVSEDFSSCLYGISYSRPFIANEVQWTYASSRSSINVSKPSCPTTYNATVSGTELASFSCMCSGNDCNKLDNLANVTVSLYGETSTSTPSATLNSSSTNQDPTNSSLTEVSTVHSNHVLQSVMSTNNFTPTDIVMTKSNSDIRTIATSQVNTMTSVVDKDTQQDIVMTKSNSDIRTVATSQVNTMTSVVDKVQQDNQQVFVSIIVALILAVVAILTTLLFIILLSMYRKHVAKRSQHSIHRIHTPPPMYDADLADSSFPISILHTIGYGKFGSVYKALYEGVPVAVKIFGSHHLGSWNNEKHIYTLESTPHEHILHFIDCEQRGIGSHRQLYMMTEYHALGSLSRFLQHNKLNWNQALRAIHSVSCGLAHLHSNSYINREGSVQEKLAIAHRDVKSANVLVKDTSGHCVLGDLGLGIILDPTDIDDKRMARSGQVGTYRYMAPEALDARVNLRDIESFKQIDVYALALVLWEVCTRCEFSDDLVPPYQSPYSSIVGERPTLDLMKHVVVVEKSRPHIMGYWESHPGLKQVIIMMEESWDEDPEARLTAANIVSRLENLERMQRKEELGNEVESSLRNASHPSSVTEPRTHKKVRVSSSFSGQPHNQPVIAQRVRLSVGNAELSTNNFVPPFQRYRRRSSVVHHSDLRENSSMAGSETLRTTEFSHCEVSTVSPVESSTSQVNDEINNDNNFLQMNIDAATGQPSALTQSSSISLASLDSTQL